MKKVLLLALALIVAGFTEAQTHWNARNFKNYKMVKGVIIIDREEQFNANLEVGAFCGEECRAAIKAAFFPPSSQYVVNLNIGSDSDNPNETISFKIFDHGSGNELSLDGVDLILTNFEALGSMGNWYQFTFTTPATQTYEYPLHIDGYGDSDGGYYLIAPPFNDIDPASIDGMTSQNINEFDLYYFDESQELEWINYIADLQGNINPEFGNLMSGKGYLYAHQTDVNLVFTTTDPYNGDGKVTLRKTNGAQWSGWNLIGNPWGNQSATLGDRDYYRMNTDGLELITDNSDINPMEGVFVIAANDGEVITFTPGPSEGKSQIAINVLKDRGNTIDRAIVRLGEGGTLPKFMLNPENTKIYIEQGGDDYAVVSSNEDEIPVSFKAASNGTYTLNVAVQNAEMDYLHLVDNLAGTDTDLLANPNYTFEANTGDYASRFTLVLRNTTGLVEHFAFFNGHNWTVSNQGEATLQVIDVTGRLVSTKTIDGTTQLDINAAPGVYMLRLVNGSDVKVQKVIVR